MRNQRRGSIYLFGLIGTLLAVGLACATLTSSPAPTAAPTATPEAAAPTAGNASTSSDLVTFTDQNGYFAIDLPGDWQHTQDVDKEKNYWYWDVFSAPDGHAKVDSIVYDDGTAWTGSDNGRQALYLLNKFYSNTGAEGDIRITDDRIQQDHSERLTWSSRGGKYSGVSFFEVRNRTAFLMFTTWWDNDYESQYGQALDDVVSSYRLP